MTRTYICEFMVKVPVKITNAVSPEQAREQARQFMQHNHPHHFLLSVEPAPEIAAERLA